MGNRRCPNFPATIAVDRCDRCGEAFCAACLSHLEQWRLCTACAAWLRRGGDVPTLLQRGQRLLARLLAVGGVVAALALIVLLLNMVMGGAGSNAAIGGASSAVRCLQHFPDRKRLYVAGTPPANGYPPPQLELESCGFQPGEVAQVTLLFSGYDRCGRPFHDAVGPLKAVAGTQGVLHLLLTVPDRTRPVGRYRLQVIANGAAGSQAILDQQPEGNPAALRCIG